MTTADPAARNAAAAPAPDPFDALERRRRPWWIIPVAILIAVGGWYYFAKVRNRAPPAPRYLTTRIEAGNLVESVEATGTVQPVQQVQVGAQISGRIRTLAADYNTRVRTGQLLAELDPAPFQMQVAQARAGVLSARAQVARARADLALAERNLVRAIEMRSRGLNAPSEVDSARGARDAARAQVGVAQAQVAQAAAQLDSARTNLSYTRITAPIDGIVITRSIDVGQTVAASFQAPVLFVIANDLTHMQVVADIDEADVGKLREGLTADARVDAFPGETFPGSVRELRFGPTTNQGVVTYPAVIDVDNHAGQLRPGMTATITVITARHSNVLRVPNAALRFRPSNRDGAGRGARGGAAGTRGGSGGGGGGTGGNTTGGPGGPGGPGGGGEGPGGAPAPGRGRIFVLRGGRATPVPVRVGISDGTFTEVESPELHAGDEVITDETDEQAGAGRAAGGGGGGSRGGTRRVF